MIIDVIQGDWLDAGLNFAGTFIDATDVVKTGRIDYRKIFNYLAGIRIYCGCRKKM